jgi:uncharacterized iron-regulated membrane protein
MSRSVPVSSGKRPALGHRAKRWLYIIHRWIGIFSCLLFAVWFLSGLVMIYVPYPALKLGQPFLRRAGTWVHIDPATGAILGDIDLAGSIAGCSTCCTNGI